MTTATVSETRALMISEEERAELLRLLEQLLGETRVEIHRTHTPDYRAMVISQESLLRGLLAKLREV